MNDELDKVFDIAPADFNVETNSVIATPETEESAEDSDFKYARQNQIDFIEVSKAAVQTAMKVAVQSENPKAIESLSMMLKTASEMNRQLVLQSKDRAETKSAKKNAGVASTTPANAGVVNNTIVMTGTMQDMINELRRLKENAG